MHDSQTPFLLKPPEEPGKKKAFVLTLLVHGVLVVFLFFGVQWKQKDTTVEVELWSSVPTPATQLPPPPPVPEETKPEPKPEPPKLEPKPLPKVEPKPEIKPDIALKDDKKKKELPKKPEPKPEPPKPEPKKPELKKPEVKDLFKEQLEREDKQRSAQKASQERAEKANQLAALAAVEQKAAGRASGLASYVAKIRTKIKGNITLPIGIQGNPEAVFQVTQLPDGTILDGGVKLISSSGNSQLDASIERALLKSSPLPKPDDPSLFQRVLEIRYKPFD
jgi:colicin import membrane protein